MSNLSTSPLPVRKLCDASDYDGLAVHIGDGYERAIMSTHEIVDDVLSTLPKLEAAVRSGTFGRRWIQRRRKNRLDQFELSPRGGGDPDDDMDIAYAMATKTEISCYLNEVINVLVHPANPDCDASMKSLFGRKCKGGKSLLQLRRGIRPRVQPLPPHSRRRTASNAQSAANVHKSSGHDPSMSGHEADVGVHMVVLKQRRMAKFHSKHKQKQKLVFASVTQSIPGQDRAVHMMKTLPKHAHDQLVASTYCSALRRRLNHIAIGFDIQAEHGEYGAHSHRTRVFAYAYASSVAPADFAQNPSNVSLTPTATAAASVPTPIVKLSTLSPREREKQRKSVMNPEARGVVSVLSKALLQMEDVIRRRRFGFQSFVYFASDESSRIADVVDSHASASTDAPPLLLPRRGCAVCCKSFSLCRRARFCQLCGHAVCGDCSRHYDVEPRPGHVRQNRICVQCVVRVDACVFDDADLLSALGPVVVDADPAAWDDDYPLLSQCEEGTYGSDTSASSSFGSVDDIKGDLYSEDATVRSRALEKLARLVHADDHASASTSTSTTVHTDPHRVLTTVNEHLQTSIRNAQWQYKSRNCEVYDGARDYAYEFEQEDSVVPLVPLPSRDRETARLDNIHKTGVLAKTYDRKGLDLLARLAATHLRCGTGYISVVGSDTQHIVGSFNFPEQAATVPRDGALCSYSVYAETPVVLTNPQRDLRFAQLPIVRDVGFKFYAGFPIKAADGTVIASICTADVQPHRHITTKDYATMETLSGLAAELLRGQE